MTESDREGLSPAEEYSLHGRALFAALAEGGFPVSSLEEVRALGPAAIGALGLLMAWYRQTTYFPLKWDVVMTLTQRWARKQTKQWLFEQFRAEAPHDPSGIGWVLGNAVEVVSTATDVPELLQLSTDERYGVARGALFEAFVRLRSAKAQAVPVLCGLLSDPLVAGYAAAALGSIGDIAALEPLKRAREFSESEATSEIDSAIKRLQRPSPRPRHST